MKRILAVLPILALMACNDHHHDETEADRVGVASECVDTLDCPIYVLPDLEPQQMVCLSAFAGGYCGVENCLHNADCPDGSVCVAHTDGVNYCFRACIDKSECNWNRSSENAANCSSSFEWAVPSESDKRKACIPPSSGR